MLDILSRRVAKVLPDTKQLDELLNSKKIRVYLGIDPTGGKLHIGHAVGIKKLMEFATAGHEAILLFGTGTVLVGDPSLRESQRGTVSDEEISKNIQTWQEQVEPIIDFDKVSIKQNGDWITNLSIKELVNIASNISAIQLFKRESFTRRIEKGDTVWYHETMYPLLQGYDSVVMDVDLEIGGTDQEFNMLMGRELQKKINNREKYVLTTPMILGTDGQQMSKTSNNCVWLQDSPSEMFGKLMSIPDEQIVSYLRLCTDMPIDKIVEIDNQLNSDANPRDLKLLMSEEITKIWHSSKLSAEAKKDWLAQFSEKGTPKDIPTVEVNSAESISISEILFNYHIVASKSEARRLIDQGAVKINQIKISTDTLKLKSGDIIQAGKRRFLQVK